MMFGSLAIIPFNSWAWCVVFLLGNFLANDILQDFYKKQQRKYHIAHLKPKVSYDTYFKEKTVESQ
jgi:hypothetical protein